MLDDLEIFLCVAAHGSLNKAAAQLGLPKSTVSRRLAALEEQLGASLFVRSRDGLAPSHAGALLRARCEGPMGALRGGLADVRRDLGAIEGALRIALPTTFATFVCPPVLRAFAEQHPGVTLDLVLDNAPTDPATSGWDAAIRIGPLPNGDLRALLLGEVRGVLFASPAYLGRHGVPSPDTLHEHRSVVYRSPSFGARWELVGPDGVPRTFELPVSVSTNDLAMVREAALLGLGVGRAPGYVVADDLRTGRLVRVLEGFTSEPRKVHALHAAGRLPSARVRAFLDHVAATLRASDLDATGRGEVREASAEAS